MTPILYIVIPCYNEEAVLPITAPLFLKKIQDLSAAGKISEDSRILFVNDGSRDQTWQIICSLAEQDRHYIGIAQSRNRGHQNAVFAGLMEAKDRCDITISIDCDGQDDINAMDQMVDAYLNGYDVVYGVRSSRETDSFFKRSTASLYYKGMRWLGCELLPDSADYRLLSDRALEALMQYGESDLFIRGMVPTLGFKSAIVEFEVHERTAGRTKFTLRKMLSLAGSGITSFSTRPIHLVFLLGLLVMLTSGIMMCHILFDYLHHNTVSGWSSILASIWLLGGIGIFSIGIVGEYVGRAYMEAKKRPRYFIEEKKIHKNKEDEKP